MTEVGQGEVGNDPDAIPPDQEDEEIVAEEAEESAEEADGIAVALASLDSRLEESQRLLDRQAGLVDRLHAENQDLRAGELRAAQSPLIRDLLRLHDDLVRMRESASESDHDLRLVQESLVDVLGRNGVTSFEPANGEPFDPRMHSAAGTETTDDESLDRTVGEVVRRGFRWDSGEVIRVPEVRVYRYAG